MAGILLSYTCELWMTTEKQESKIEASEISFLKLIKNCFRHDHTRSEDIRE